MQEKADIHQHQIKIAWNKMQGKTKICVQVDDVIIEAICVNKHMFPHRKPMHAFSNEK